MKILKKLKLNRGHLIGTAALAATIVMPEMAFAQTSSSTEISLPVYDKIESFMTGFGGKLITLIAFAMGIIASVGGMSRAAIFTPFGVGMFVTATPTLVNWLFPGVTTAG